jgi:hypothetical protein
MFILYLENKIWIPARADEDVRHSESASGTTFRKEALPPAFRRESRCMVSNTHTTSFNKIPHNTSKEKKSSHQPQRSLRKYKKEIKR